MMKYIIASLAFIIAHISIANAGYIEDVRSLGYISGEGIACGAEKYAAYEIIARSFLISSAKSDAEQNEGMYAYNEAKAQAYIRVRHSGKFNCDEIKSRFDKQEIFKTKLYKNGTLKMPDGKIIKPRIAYDATQVYDKTYNEKEHLDEHFDKILAKKRKQAQKEGIYRKIQQEEANRHF